MSGDGVVCAQDMSAVELEEAADVLARPPAPVPPPRVSLPPRLAWRERGGVPGSLGFGPGRSTSRVDRAWAQGPAATTA